MGLASGPVGIGLGGGRYGGEFGWVTGVTVIDKGMVLLVLNV